MLVVELRLFIAVQIRMFLILLPEAEAEEVILVEGMEVALPEITEQITPIGMLMEGTVVLKQPEELEEGALEEMEVLALLDKEVMHIITLQMVQAVMDGLLEVEEVLEVEMAGKVAEAEATMAVVVEVLTLLVLAGVAALDL